MFKVKVYKVYPKDDPSIYFLLEAPNKRIAKWCGADCYINYYPGFRTIKDMVVERIKTKED